LQIVRDIFASGLDADQARALMKEMGFAKARIWQLLKAVGGREPMPTESEDLDPAVEEELPKDSIGGAASADVGVIKLNERPLDVDLLDDDAPMTEVAPELLPVGATIWTPARQRAATYAGLPSLDACETTPPDGLCLSYCCCAALELTEWMATSRDLHGFIEDIAEELTWKSKAQIFFARVLSLLEAAAERPMVSPISRVDSVNIFPS
jgi:hypothetical protein